jgi:periplasmic divalent cation tolerance protein
MRLSLPTENIKLSNFTVDSVSSELMNGQQHSKIMQPDLTTQRKYCTVMTSFPDAEVALGISKLLVEEKLCACISIQPNCISVYSWENQLHEQNEVLAVIKSRTDILQKLKERLLELHPYKVPEIIATEIIDGSMSYLNWIDTTLDS